MTPKLQIASTTEIKVEKGIPLATAGSGGCHARYPWKTMEIGDSFAVPSDVIVDNFRRSANTAAKTNARKFSIRKVDGGYRCWRVA